MPQRQCNKQQSKVAKMNPRVILPISYAEYERVADDASQFRQWLDAMIGQFPELFPQQIGEGYTLHDRLPPSAKLSGIRFRRIKLKAAAPVQVFTICASDVMPYMTGFTTDIEKALFLRRFNIPYWGLTYVFGRNDAYWYRLTATFGRYEIVSTVVKDPECLPDDLLADEKHTRFNGEKGYIATTVGAECILGASLAMKADEDALLSAYGAFKAEAQVVKPDYAPKTVNTDGWQATQKAWRTLFPLITIIHCFLHAFLKIRNRTKKRFKAVYAEIQQQVWDIYRANNPQDFLRQMADFRQWAAEHLSGPAFEAVEKLCAKTDLFLLAFDFPNAYRTSNMIDRHMIPLDRWLFTARYFHGNWRSAELQIRAWTLFHNFLPYCPRASVRKQFVSPVHQLNGFLYHDNWLQNLLISTSCAGLPTNHRKR